MRAFETHGALGGSRGELQDRARFGAGKVRGAVAGEGARRQPPRDATRAQAVRQAEIRRLAVALLDGRRELASNRTQLQRLVNDLAPGLTDRKGIGPISAAPVIVAFSHPGRCRNDAAFAALGGISPREASGGRTKRHRLNPGGDRTRNQAIHTIAKSRMRDCPRTRDYVTRRVAEGKRNPKSADASSATSPARSTAASPPP